MPHLLERYASNTHFVDFFKVISIAYKHAIYICIYTHSQSHTYSSLHLHTNTCNTVTEDKNNKNKETKGNKQTKYSINHILILFFFLFVFRKIRHFKRFFYFVVFSDKFSQFFLDSTSCFANSALDNIDNRPP